MAPANGASRAYEFLLQRLVDNEVHDSLRNSKVARGDSFVEASEAVRLVNLLNALSNIHLAAGVVVQLQARLHKPDRVCGSRGDEAGTGCAQNMGEWRVDGEDSVGRR